MAGQARSIARREDILAATVSLVSERGHQAVRIADVAQRTGVSPGLIIYHFRTKWGLVAAAFAAAAENDLRRAQEIVAGEEAPLERLLKLVYWYLPTEERSRSWRIWFDGWAASQFDAYLAEVIQKFDRAWDELVAEALAACRARGEVDIEDLMESTLTLAAFLNGVSAMSLTGTETLSTELLRRRARVFLQRQFGADLEKLPG